jgi:hypothetical protein
VSPWSVPTSIFATRTTSTGSSSATGRTASSSSSSPSPTVGDARSGATGTSRPRRGGVTTTSTAHRFFRDAQNRKPPRKEVVIWRVPLSMRCRRILRGRVGPIGGDRRARGHADSSSPSAELQAARVRTARQRARPVSRRRIAVDVPDGFAAAEHAAAAGRGSRTAGRRDLQLLGAPAPDGEAGRRCTPAHRGKHDGSRRCNGQQSRRWRNSRMLRDRRRGPSPDHDGDALAVDRGARWEQDSSTDRAAIRRPASATLHKIYVLRTSERPATVARGYP